MGDEVGDEVGEEVVEEVVEEVGEEVGDEVGKSHRQQARNNRVKRNSCHRQKRKISEADWKIRKYLYKLLK